MLQRTAIQALFITVPLGVGLSVFGVIYVCLTLSGLSNATGLMFSLGISVFMAVWTAVLSQSTTTRSWLALALLLLTQILRVQIKRFFA